MRFFESFWVALSTYSAVPVPQMEWKTQNMRYAICFFPVVGILCGGVLWGWMMLSAALDVSCGFCAAVAVGIPLLLTGGIHMDGFMDTVDALASHQDRQRKLEILKDPHCGAFAVIYCGVYLLADTGLSYELIRQGQFTLLCPAFVLSRALSGLLAVHTPNARGSGMLCAFTENAEKRTVTLILAAALLLSGGGMLWCSPAGGGAAVLFALVWAVAYRALALRQFGGVTGDTSGFFLQVCELACLAGVWLGGLL